MNAHVVVEFLLVWMGLSLTVPGELLALGYQTGGLLLSDRDPKPRRCQYSKISGMLQAKCAELNLNEFPKNLRTDIEILDFSVNRMRDLNNKTLAPYTSLSFLYLMDNFIQTIEEGAFSQLTNIQVINLNTNGIGEFPNSIFSLPSLKRFYLAANRIRDESVRPTGLAENSNLELLDLSGNQLTSLPHLGILPRLKYLNMSGNSIRQLKPDDVAIFCSLESLDITNNPLILDDCSCHALSEWIAIRNIKLYPDKLQCTTDRKRCTYRPDNPITSNDTVKLFDSCKYVLKTSEELAKARSTWILVGSSVSVFLVVLFISFYYIHRRNRRKKILKKNNEKGQLAVNHANTELLNDKNRQDDA
ncbi:leucine-rich repeat-containing protein 19 isoform X2 [Fopius arisanus]|nr:PREDICTED: leucine-rich repeat-containing protein 19 isoform X2 [Fopius arisanus]XP_011301158.1 PREDICTED: leucine-rich repeat-containing protein 19 isoform X2 [Fopius arisanus]XP_011301159.1 PREDICTED: leucine-rich repeat-containing protein 19 isoform X2 [Fopius arisanus]XP_011301160.1 PREDICTED: leucine-rich repeat-containing protein 19 isoform X2 [Fopius arisanus]